jgi:hypothetical protein
MLRIMGHHRLAGSFEFFKAADDLAAEAEAAGHTAVLHVVQVARLSAHFHLRKWDSLRETFEAAAKLLGIVDGQKHDELIADPATLVATLHYYQFKALHASRGGETNVAKRTIGVLFDLLDASKIHSVMANLRANGGILKVKLHVQSR